MRAPRVLLVDDDDDLCRRVADALRATGVQVLTAHTRDALAVMRQFRVDLVVVDVELGDRSCVAFLDARAREHAGIVAMFVSMHSHLEIARVGHGSRYFLSKAVASEILVHSILNAALLLVP